MNLTSLINLLLLSAIWGGSFLFLRMAAPALGPVLLIEFRVGLAALFLLGVALLWRKRRHATAPVQGLQLRRYWKHYLLLGGLNSALPFLLLAYAAQTLTASLLSILNATSPVWGALVGALWARTPLSATTLSGLVVGAAGVAILVSFDRVTLLPGSGLAIAAALGAALSYGIASNYTRYATHASALAPFNNAHGSMWGATLLIAPALLLVPAPPLPGSDIIAAVVTLGVLCSGIAYLLYFRLVADIGPTSALTVTFLIPLFGVLWGYGLLDETVGWHTLIGSLTVVTGTALVTGFSPRALFAPRKPSHV